jgi:hypothetical protein
MKPASGEYLIGAEREEREEARGLHALHGGRTEKLKQGSEEHEQNTEVSEERVRKYNFTINFTGQ